LHGPVGRERGRVPCRRKSPGAGAAGIRRLARPPAGHAAAAWPPRAAGPAHRTPRRASRGARLTMLTLCRLIRIVLVCLRYRLDELVLSSIKHPVAHGLLKVVRFGRPPRMARGVRLRLALEAL